QAKAPITVTAYAMAVMPAADTLAGKKAVVFDLAMADKVLPKKATGTSGGGGLGGALIGAAGNAADLKNFNDAVTSESWLTQEREALTRKQVTLYEKFNARYTELNEAGTERAVFDFGGVSPTPDYFSVNTGNAGVAAKIAAACEENGADFAVTMIGQVVHGETMQAAPISSSADMRVEVCLFDKTGALAAQGQIVTLAGDVKPASGITTFRLFLDDAIEDIILMIPALGGNGDRTVTKEYTPPTADTGDTREAGPGETVLVVKRIDGNSGWPTSLVLDKGADNERMIKLAVKKEVRMVIPNGNHVLAAEIEGGTKEKNDPISITADGTPITYTLSVKGTIGQGNLKDNERFTWKKQ
ncbi:MAG: hypothetical protein LBF78_11905, partial [Treponema sp.]|nr:hypothetical protein [Treponema sp.]